MSLIIGLPRPVKTRSGPRLVIWLEFSFIFYPFRSMNYNTFSHVFLFLRFWQTTNVLKLLKL